MKHSERLRALRETRLLDTPAEETFDRVTRLVKRLIGVPVSLVSLVDQDRQFFKSQQGLPEPWATQRETPLSHSFCQHVAASREPLVVRDAAEHELVRENLARRDLGVVGYLGVPLVTDGGQAIGSLCAITAVPRDWDADDIAVMKDLAAIVMTEIRLKAENRQREAAQAELQLLAGELQHRIKNSLAITQAIVQLSFRTAQGMAGLKEAIGDRLSALSATHDLLTGDVRKVLPLRGLFERELSAIDPLGRATFEGPDLDLDLATGVPLGMIAHELATNAAKYGALTLDEGRIAVSWSLAEDDCTVVWRESGPGLNVAPPTRRGFGSSLIERIARQFDGQAEVAYLPDGVLATVVVRRGIEVPDREGDPARA